MINNKLTAEQKISKAKVAIINQPEWRWLGSIVMMGNLEFVDGAETRVKTAATDGMNEVYNRDYLATLTNEQVMFLVLHENFHKLFRHLYVWQSLFKENAQLANIACDAVINNQYLVGQKGIEFIVGGVDMPKYKDKDVWNAKKIFDDLKQNGGGNQGQNSLDTHEWEKARDATPEEVERIEKQIDTALRQAALAGNIGGGMPRHIKEMLVPKLDWRQLLSEFLKTVTSGNDKQTWRKPHRTYVPYGFYMPAPYSESVGRILIAGDTSGSIGDAMLGKFLGHMQTLCNEVSPDGVDIAWWGSSVVGVDTFERGALGDLANAVKPIGGGGTTPACITDWMKKNKKDYICTIVITDGEFYGDDIGDWGDMPVLWLVINSRNVANIPVGITVKVAEMD